MHIFSLLFSAVFMFSADHAHAEKKKSERPCAKIVEACAAAGFVKGGAKEGNGMWKDCVIPIVKGEPQAATAKIKLPAVDAAIVAACKEKHPGFGQGKKAGGSE